MATKALEAFVRLFADDSELRKAFAGLPGAARKAGDAAGLQFSEGLNRSITQQAVTPGRATGARPLLLPRVGGREVDLSSPFSTGFQRFRRARELADLTGGRPGGIVPGLGGLGRGAGGGGAGGGELVTSLGRGFSGIGALGGSGLARGATLLPALANPISAAVLATAGTIGAYVSGLEAATKAARELAKAHQAGDLAGVSRIFQQSTAAVREYEANLHDASAALTSMESVARRGIARFKIGLAELTGRGLAQLDREAKAAEQAAKNMWVAIGGPKLRSDQLRRGAQELAQIAQASMKAAADAFEYSKAVDLLTQSKEREAEASRQAIAAEKTKIDLDKIAGTLTADEAADRRADADESLAAVERQLGRDRAEIAQDGRRQLAEMEAAELEHTATIEAQQQQRRDVIVQTLGRVIEAEAAANGSLQRLFRTRAANQAEDTATALAALERETARRRRALEVRIGGAQGDERVRLERELSRVTEEEATKRTAIEAKAAEDRIRLARQTQQELRAQQEAIFSIQRTLGQRSLQDDLGRFAATARGAEAGSKTQLDALARVAAAVKGLADQARQFLTEALSASDTVAQRLGRESPEFVSLAGLAEDAATQQRHLEEQQRILETGGQIRREDFQALAGGRLERLQTQSAAGRFVTAADLARRSVDQGQSLDAFQAGLPGIRNLARPERLFGAQLGEAFTAPEDLFRRATGGMSDALEEFVKSADSDFQELELIVDRSMTNIEQRVERTSSTLRTRLREVIKTDIARELDRDEKLY